MFKPSLSQTIFVLTLLAVGGLTLLRESPHRITLRAAVAAETDASPLDLAHPAFHLSQPLSPQLPYDVNLSALRALSTTPHQKEAPFDVSPDNVPYAERLFDVFAWQSFLALNWPAKEDGSPDTRKTLADTSTSRVWESYCEAGRVFRENGDAPDPWEKAVADSWSPEKRTLWVSGMGIGERDGDRRPVLDESLQAFTGPLIDQEGKWVRYQAAVNRTEFDYLVENKLYNLEGQVAFTRKNKISFPVNKGTSKHGAMEIKLSWKQLSDSDDRKRFLVRRSNVKPHTGSPYQADFGLVGMHIAVRTESSPTWIWATFEQVDNTTVNDLEKGHGKQPRRPTFFNPDNAVKPVNVLAPKNAVPNVKGQFTTWDENLTTIPTQVLSVLPVPKSTAALNREVQDQLARLGSVFRYYELIGTQWPTEPEFPGFPNGVATQSDGQLLPSSPESILFKVPGKVHPVHLVNTTMETFFQGGNQVAGPLAEDSRLPPGQVADPSIVFSTESCAGCHFSAGAAIAFKKSTDGRFLVEARNGLNYRVPIFGKDAYRGLNGSGDYSWLLQLRAQQAPYTGTDTAPLQQSLIAP